MSEADFRLAALFGDFKNNFGAVPLRLVLREIPLLDV